MKESNFLSFFEFDRRQIVSLQESASSIGTNSFRIKVQTVIKVPQTDRKFGLIAHIYLEIKLNIVRTVWTVVKTDYSGIRNTIRQFLITFLALVCECKMT